MNEFKLIEKIKKEEENISVLASEYIFSCLWLLKICSKLDEKKLKNLFYEVVEKFYEKNLPSFSFVFLLLDEELKNSIIKILKKYDSNFLPNFWMDPYKNEYKEKIEYEALLRMLKKGDILHSLFVIAVNILSSRFSKIEIVFTKGATISNINTLKKNKSEIFKHARTARSFLAGSEWIQDGMGYKLGNSILEESLQKFKNNQFTNVKNKIISPKKIKFKNISLLSGNGFSKYITSKYFKDDWLSSNKNFKSIFTYMNKRIDSIVSDINKKIDSISFNKTLNNNPNFKSESTKLIEWNKKQKKYINSKKIIVNIMTFLERFLNIQNQFFEWINEIIIQKKKFHINWKETEIKKFLEKLNILEFNHQNRNYLFYLFMYIHVEDYFYNIEAFLSIMDKFTNVSNNRDKIDIHYVLNHVFTEAYIEKIWNKGKINQKIKIKNKKFKFNQIYTLNYDNLTDQIFGDAIHLHGQFEFVADPSKNKTWNIKKIKLLDKEYFKQTFLKRSSVVLKGGDYKIDYILKLVSKKINYKYREYLKKLWNDKSNFLIIGTLIIGDPHILDIILNNANVVYITYYSETEFQKLQTLIGLCKITNKKSKIFFIEFQKLMKFMNI